MGKFYGNKLKAGRNQLIVVARDQLKFTFQKIGDIFSTSRQAVWRAYWDSKKKLGG